MNFKLMDRKQLEQFARCYYNANTSLNQALNNLLKVIENEKNRKYPDGAISQPPSPRAHKKAGKVIEMKVK